MAWRFRHFELPDDHAFIYSMRGLADGVFKVFGWLALAATFQVAAQTTHSKFLWVICGISYLMIIAYLQTFLSWIGELKFHGWARPIREYRPGYASKLKLVRGLSRILASAASLLIWLILVMGMQTAVEQSVAAIVDFQTSAKSR